MVQKVNEEKDEKVKGGFDSVLQSGEVLENSQGEKNSEKMT